MAAPLNPARRRPAGGDAPPLPAGTRAPVAGLKPLPGLGAFARAVPGAEPPPDELVRLLRAGRQPYLVVVSGGWVVFGWALVPAARAAGRETVWVVGCDGGDGLDPGDLLLKAAGLHLRAAVDRLGPDDFAARLMGAALYDAWAGNFPRRPPRRPSPVKRRARAELRARLVREAFGRAARTLERDRALARLAPDLRAAVRDGRLPVGVVEGVGRLGRQAQLDLAARLKTGDAFAELKAEFLGDGGGRRKTGRGAAAAIRAGLHAVVREARGREDGFRLRADEYPVAREAVGLLGRWLAAPPPHATVEQQVERIAADLRGGRPGPGGAAAAGGGRGAAGGPR